MLTTTVNSASKKRYSVSIEGLDQEIVDIMYGAGMTDSIAYLETDDLEDKNQMYCSLANFEEEQGYVPEEDVGLRAFVNELDFFSDKAKSDLLKTGKFLINGDYWILSVIDNSFKSKK